MPFFKELGARSPSPEPPPISQARKQKKRMLFVQKSSRMASVWTLSRRVDAVLRRASASVVRGDFGRGSLRQLSANGGGSKPQPAGSLHHLSAGIGFLAGTFGSLVGLGGGVVAVPLLVSYGRVSQHVAHGTSLVAVVCTGVGGCLGYARHGEVDWLPALAIASTASITAVVGARVTMSISAGTLKRLMGVFMMVVAPLVPLKDKILKYQTQPDDARRGPGPANASLLASCAALGVVSGLLSGMFGVGGGSIVTPVLAWIADMPHHTVIGTSLAAMVIPSILGARTHLALGNVSVAIAPGLVVGTLAGAWLGAYAANKVPQDTLRYVFCGAFLFLGARSAGLLP